MLFLIVSCAFLKAYQNTLGNWSQGSLSRRSVAAGQARFLVRPGQKDHDD
jgi:hypothetical protein